MKKRSDRQKPKPMLPTIAGQPNFSNGAGVNTFPSMVLNFFTADVYCHTALDFSKSWFFLILNINFGIK